MTHSNGKAWSVNWSSAVGSAIQQERKRGKVTVQKLSERCSELGYPIPRSTLTNLELGRKESVVLQEVLVIAEALGVAPMELLVPLGNGAPIEILPGRQIPPREALEWIAGSDASGAAYKAGVRAAIDAAMNLI